MSDHCQRQGASKDPKYKPQADVAKNQLVSEFVYKDSINKKGVSMGHANIKVLPFTGKRIKNYLPSIAKLNIEVMRDYPFLQNRHLDEEMERLHKYAHAPDAIIVIVFDGPAIVGASTGIALHRESEELHKPFIEHNKELADYYFFNESLLLKPYRGRGIGHHFFDLREEYVAKQTAFKQICFCTVARPENDPKKPEDYLPLHDFWRKRGFAEHPELYCHFDWIDYQETDPSQKKATFWIRSLY